MDAVLRNFKLIPCPAGENCKAANCQWGHPPPKPSSASNSAREDEGQENDGPRKRRRMGSETEDHHQPVPPHSLVTTASRPVSPPPLKRKVPAGASSGSRSLLNQAASSTPTRTKGSEEIEGAATSQQSARSSISRPTSPSSSTPAKPSSSVSVKKPAARKPEALNPRHLKSSAPATHDFRFKAIKMLHEQLERLNGELKKSTKAEDNKLVLTQQELIWMALDEEEKMATEKPSIYQNVIKNRIMSLKRSKPEQWKEQREAELQRTQAREALASNGKPANPFIGPEVKIDTGMEPADEVAFVKKFLLTPVENLTSHGYVAVAPSEEEIAKARDAEESSKGWEICDRCSTRFQVFPGRREDGALTSGGNCVHHPGRAYFDVDQEKRYRCCGSAVGESRGCTKGATHVFKASHPSRLAALIPFAETPANDQAPKDRGVCFDCEMGYTSRGMELIRLTATSWPDGKELLDILVNPVGEVLDLNSRYSGVWPEDFRDSLRSDEPVEWDEKSRQVLKQEQDNENRMPRRMQMVSSPVAARNMLFALIAPETPLMGHGLENDLNAVRIVHPTLVDTILLFPHRRGLPMRNGLKMLAQQHLKKIIQVDTGAGHDSAEDARTAGELVRLKVQERWNRLKALGWKLEGGVFTEPGSMSTGAE
ncbi:hypothetical protein QBC47DRAFT_297270 [Echria macrotheca]|uniref:Exonuclease domain-containing protein n=1 Tax=Echria macrotheca TaxID=438768 RepID=A0AAJ0BEP1_9PEZI|nr:hypothetical protein QBC47DRAFT_297270 [Echria macrotheca]